MENAKIMKKVIERYRNAILGCNPGNHSTRLLEMCDRLINEVNSWETMMFPGRPLGLLRCALISNEVVDLENASEFLARETIDADRSAQDLIEHLDPENGFEFEVGEEG